VAAAVREARERADEAWGVADYPERMQRAADAALAALRRADDYAAGGPPGEAALAELESTRRAVDDLVRHTRLITFVAAGERQSAIDEGADSARASYFRPREALRRFGLDPIDGDPDEVARTVAASRIRDVLLGVLLEWHDDALEMVLSRRTDYPADAAAVRDRLARVIRAARLRCGGAYARWQDLLDRKDVPGLISFAASQDGLSFRSSLVRRLENDLLIAREYQACRAYLRAAVERYPHDAWLHFELALACFLEPQRERAEALRHSAAAAALVPDSAWFHLKVARDYADLGATSQAVAEFRKTIAMSPVYAAHANYFMGLALVQAKDWEGAIPPLREAVTPAARAAGVTYLAGVGPPVFGDGPGRRRPAGRGGRRVPGGHPPQAQAGRTVLARVPRRDPSDRGPARRGAA
jgi:tetratricopeptide (TPR) repeat protein